MSERGERRASAIESLPRALPAAPAGSDHDALEAKRGRLAVILRDLESVAVAYSGGVDSAYLLAAAHDALGERCVAVTAVSPSLARDDLRIARRVARDLRARHVLVRTRELEDPRYSRNDAQRCYFCKHALFTRLCDLAATLGLRHVAYGANVDDTGDFRPGMRAAAEFGVRAPLLDAGLTKSEIRTLARARGLEVWDKPAAPCLASRLPFGTPVTVAALAQIERAERILREMGFRALRVRHHGRAARIEVPVEDIQRLRRALPEIVVRFADVGFCEVAVAPDGLRSGRLTAAAREASAR